MARLYALKERDGLSSVVVEVHLASEEYKKAAANAEAATKKHEQAVESAKKGEGSWREAKRAAVDARSAHEKAEMAAPKGSPERDKHQDSQRELKKAENHAAEEYHRRGPGGGGNDKNGEKKTRNHSGMAEEGADKNGTPTKEQQKRIDNGEKIAIHSPGLGKDNVRIHDKTGSVRTKRPGVDKDIAAYRQSKKADDLTKKAEQSGSKKDHDAAAEAHVQAQKKHEAAGNTNKAAEHKKAHDGHQEAATKKGGGGHGGANQYGPY